MEATIKLTEQELNTILKGLYLLEDQYWFRGQEFTEPLIAKLYEILNDSQDQ
jgi:hypothetical protein